MKKVFLSILLFILFIGNVEAKRGCCSHHGGVSGCSASGRQICNDGTLSPSCTCTPTYIYGCTDKTAKNYNSRANKNDGSCTYYVYGCTDKTAKNYNSKAEKDNGKCEYYIEGCMDSSAKNYNKNAEKDDGSCKYYVMGCTDIKAINYNASADKDDNSCEYEEIKETTVSNTSISNREEAKETKNETKTESKTNINPLPEILVLLLGIFGVVQYKKIKK